MKRPQTKRAEMMADAEQLAALWLRLAETRDFVALGRAMAVSKARLHAARTVMEGAGDRCRAFQQALVAALASPQSRVRFECAHGLDQFGDESTRPALAQLMDDPVPRVRWMAMHALSCHACGEKPGALEAQIRERIIDAAANDPSPQVRRHAAVALGLAREAAGAPVLDAMLACETDAKTRRMAGWARAEIDRPAKAMAPGL